MSMYFIFMAHYTSFAERIAKKSPCFKKLKEGQRLMKLIVIINEW